MAVKDIEKRLAKSQATAKKLVGKRARESLVAQCRKESQRAIETIVRIRDDPGAKPQERLRAAEILLDRGYGKAPERIEIARDLDSEDLKRLAQAIIEDETGKKLPDKVIDAEFEEENEDGRSSEVRSEDRH